LSGKFEIEYGTRMDARQAYIDATDSTDEIQTDVEIMEKVKATLKSRGLNHSEEFIRFIDLDLVFE